MNNTESSFLKDKYWGREAFRDAVEKSAEKHHRHADDDDDALPQKPREKIAHYLERIEQIATRQDTKTGKRGRLFLETSLYPKYVITPDNISDEYIKGILFGNFAEQRGYERDAVCNEELKQRLLAQFKEETGQDFAAYRIPDDERERVRTMVVTDQKSRLTTWYDYLTSDDARHAPAAFRYWAFAEMLKLGSFDEDRKVFNKRTENTAASFPELDQQALALVFDEIQRKRTGEPSHLTTRDEAAQTRFQKLLENEDFGKLYAFALEHVNSLRLPTERLPITTGEWQHFPQGTSARALTKKLEGFNTKWCIAGEGYAQDYLTRSDLWVYFSEDTDGTNTIPRACIVDSKDHGITEVRGIMSDQEAKQHVDSYITPIVAQKLKELPGGEQWQTTMDDMKRLAKAHLKHLQNDPLTQDDLVFLYEIDHSIRESGYGRDPRIAELRKARNVEADMPIVFGCTPDQIVRTPDAITDTTKAYVGPLAPGIFEMLARRDIEHIYTTFPEGRIRTMEMTLGTRTKEELTRQLEENKIHISDYGQDMYTHKDFSVAKTKETIRLVRLTVADLGFPSGATTQEIYDKANELGLDLCPAETGPTLRLQHTDQPLGDYYWIAMRQIPDRNGRPFVWGLRRHEDGLWLYDCWAKPERRWNPDYTFVFRLRKSI